MSKLRSVRTLPGRVYGHYRSQVEKRRLENQLQAAQAKLHSFKRPYNLHLGCGTVKFQGWVNIDADALLETVDLAWDMVNGLPVEDSSCGLIYSEHLMEHLAVEDGVKFMRECRRALQPGGTMRVAMPSLDDMIEKSHNGNWREQDWLTWPEFQFIQTRAEMLNINFRWWGHQWLYDREELHRRLKEAGFLKIKDVNWRESEIPALRNLETRKDSLLICEAQK